MEGYRRTGITPYYAGVLKVIEQFGAGRGTFTPQQLADSINGKITQSLRRALAQAEMDKRIEPYWYYTEKGGRAKAYIVCGEPRQLELNLFPF